MTSATLAPSELLDDPFFSRVKDHVIQVTGLSYYTTQDLELARHVFQRLVGQGMSDCCAYWNLLHDDKAGETELDLLIANLTIGETFFFRHAEQFNSLRDWVLPDVIQRNRSLRRLRIWSAGCATGAEPYSLAILLKEGWGDLLADWDVAIVATDINRTYLAQAREGRFNEWALRATPHTLQASCFLRSGNEWLIRPEYRKWISFQHHNLVQDPFPSLSSDLTAFDIILCRNVMIYFNQDVIRRIVGQFHECLTDDGWLIVGHAECQNELFPQFKTVNSSEAVLYQKGVAETSPAKQFSHFASHTNRFDASATRPKPPQAARPADAAEPTANGLCVTRRNAWEEAIQCCQERLVEEPLSPQIHFNYVLLLLARGHHAEAEQALRRTLYLDRDFILAHFHLGQLLQRRGDLSGAKRSFRNVLTLLETLDKSALIANADGLDAATLADATHRHLEVLKNL